MKITREEIRHVAALARLELSEAEATSLAADLDAILTYVAKLDELDTSDVEPTAHVVALDTPFREDRITSTPETEALVANAPARDGAFFKVPKIIE